MAPPSKPSSITPPALSETATLPPSVSAEAATLTPPPAISDSEMLPPAASVAAAETTVAVTGYEVIRELGRGGMGVVYQARHIKLNRSVALKMILAGSHAGAADLTRFQTEAEAIARLRHPNIVQVYEVGEHEGKPYFSLEFCGGGSLEKKLNGTPLPPKEAASLLETLARAMQAAHEQKVIHRDLKPANVLLAEDGTPKITDFGLAKKLDEAGQTQSGAIMGTPSYMAPEQAGGKSNETGPLADVYALGAILYECLTGRPPFKAATALDTIMQVVSDEPVPPSQLQTRLPADVETICLKCLRKDAGKRYESAAALADDLRRFQNGETIAARPAGMMERAGKWAKRRPASAALLVVCVFAGLTVVGVVGSAAALLYGKNLDLTDERDRAKTAEDRALTKEAEAIAVKTDLEKANGQLLRSRDDLETNLARSLLRPLALQGGDKPMTEPEWEALWELAADRQGRLGYRFVEEASRTPATCRQLRDRAALALSAAVGLDAERRDEVEAILITRLDDSALGSEQKTDLALAASAWDGLSNAAADRTARQLTRAMTGTKDPNALRLLAQGLSVVAPHMETKSVAPVTAHAANSLIQVMKETFDPVDLLSLAKGLSAVAVHMQAKEAATVTAQAATIIVQRMKAYTLRGDSNGVSSRLLAPGLSALAARMEARDAAQATTTLLQVIKETKDPSALVALAQALSALAARMEAEDVARTTTTLVQFMKDTKDPNGLYWLAHGFTQVAAHTGDGDTATVTAQAAASIVQAMKDTKDPNGLRLLAQALSPEVLAQGLSPVAACLDAKDAALAAPILVQALKDSKNPNDQRVLAHALSAAATRLEPRDAAQVAPTLVQAIRAPNAPSHFLAEGLSAVAARLEPRDAAQASTLLVQAMKGTKDRAPLVALARSLSAAAARTEPKDGTTTLVQAMKDTQDYYALKQLAGGLSVVAARLDAEDAAQAATVLAQLMKATQAPNTSWPAQGLSAVASRMEVKNATTMLVQAMKDTRDEAALRQLGQGLSALPRMEAKEATQAAALLGQLMNDTKDNYELLRLAQGLSALAARMEARDAATLSGKGATILISAMKGSNDSRQLGQGLSALAARMEAKDLVQTMKVTKDLETLRSLAQGLSAVSANMEPEDAAQAAHTLLQAMKHAENPYDLLSLAPSLSAMTAHMKPKDAATVSAQATSLAAKAATVTATALIEAMKNTKDPNAMRPRTEGLSAVLSDDPPAHSTFHFVTAASAASVSAGTGQPLIALAPLLPAAAPAPCRLPTQQLVELLKMPTCIGAARRVVLDHLGNRYKRTFTDMWEFVRFAREQRLALDFTSPPKRPEPAKVP